MAKAGTVYIDVRGDTLGFVSDAENAGRKVERSLASMTRNGLKGVTSDLGEITTAAGRAALVIGGAAVKASTDFNKSMSGVSAVAGATAEEMVLLRDAAIDAGAATAFGASDAAVAEAELAKAGVAVADILGGALAGSLDLAAAGQLDLGNAAEIAAQSMNIFNLSGDKVSHIADVLAAGANKSAADVSGLGQSLRQAGLVASQAGLGLEDTVGVLSLFSDNALIGSDAGTSLKTMLQRLAPQSKEAATAMDEVGLSFFDAEGKFVGIEEAAGRIQTAFSDLTEEQRLTAMTTIFGSDAVRAAGVLYEAGADGVRDYVEAVDDQGAAAEMAAEQLNNLAGDVEEFSGSAETALISLGGVADPVLRSFTQGGTDLVNVFNDFAGTEAFDRITAGITEFGDRGTDALDGVADQLDALLSGISESDIDDFFSNAADGADFLGENLEGLEGLAAGTSVALASMAGRSVLGPLGSLVPHVGFVTAAVGGLLATSDRGRQGLVDLAGTAKDAGIDSFPKLADAARDVVEPLEDVLVSGIELATNVLPDIADTAAAAADIVGPVLGGGAELAAEGMEFLADNADLVVPALAAVGTGIGILKLEQFATNISNAGGLLQVLQQRAKAAAGAQGLGQLARVAADPVMALGLGGIALGVGVLTKNFLDNKREAAESAERIDQWKESIEAAGSVAEGVRDNFANLFAEGLNDGDEDLESARVAMAALDIQMNDLTDAMIAGDGSFEQAAISLGNQTEAALLARTGYADYESGLARVHELQDKGTEITSEEARELYNLRGALNDARDAGDGVTDSLLGMNDEQRAAIEELQRDLEIKRENRSATEELADAIDGLKSAQDRLAGIEKNLNDARRDSINAMRRFNETNIEAAGSMDINTEAGQKNFEAYRKSLTATKEFALAQLAADGDTQTATSSLTNMAEGLLELASQGKLSTEQVESLTRELGLTPKDIEIAVENQQIVDARERTDELKERLELVTDADHRAEIETLLDDDKLKEAEDRLAEIEGETIARIRIETIGNVPSGFVGAPGPAVIPNADGAVYPAGMDPFIAPDGANYFMAAERGTGGEAFIPLAPSKRDKSVKLFYETGKHLGIIPRADGGITNAGDLQSEQFRNQIDFLGDLNEAAGNADWFKFLQTTTPKWSDDWMRWVEAEARVRERVASENERALEEAKSLADEKRANQIEYKASQLSGNDAIAFFKKQRDGFEDFTNEWVRWNQRIKRAEDDLARTREKAAADRKREQEREQAAIRNAREDAPTIVIHEVNVTESVSLADELDMLQRIHAPVEADL